MNEPIRLRYVNQLVGAFILLIVALLLVGTVIVVRQQEIFVPEYEIFAFVAETELKGLGKGTEVLVLGRQAGEIDDIRYFDGERDGKNVRVSMKIKETFRDKIFTDSVAHLKRRLAGAGEAYLEITRGPRHQTVLPTRGDLKVVSEPEPASELARVTGMIDDIRGYFEDVRNSMVDAFDRFGTAADTFNASNEQLQGVLTELEDFAPRLTPLAEKSETFLESSQEVVDALRAETENLPGTVLKLQDDLDGAQEIIEGIRSHWLLRRYIDRGDADTLISPSQMGRGALP